MTTPVLPGLDLGPAGRALPDERLRQKELSQYFTPEWLADEIVARADIEGESVLEPSAGDGALVAACLRAGAARILAVEVDPAMCSGLRVRFAAEIDAESVEVVCADFLTLPLARHEGFRHIVGNPPYDSGSDGDHLARVADALASSWGYATLLLRTVALHGGDRYKRAWSRMTVWRVDPCVDRIPFVIDGDDSEAGKIDVSIFSLRERRDNDEAFCRHVRQKNRST